MRLDPAAVLAPFARPANRSVVIFMALMFLTGIATAPTRPLFPVYVVADLHLPVIFASTIFALQLGIGGVFALLGGAMSDLIGRRQAVLVGLTSSLFGAALLLAGDTGLLLAIAFLWGVTLGVNSAAGQSYMLGVVRRGRLGTTTAVYFMSGTASNAIGALVAGWLADQVGFRAVGLLTAGLSALVLIAAVRWLPNLADEGAVAGDGELGRRAADGSAAIMSPPVGGSRSGPARGLGDPGTVLRSYLALLGQREVLLIGALRYFPTFAWGIATLVMPVMVYRASGSASIVGWFSFVSSIMAAGAQLATGRLIDVRGGSARWLVVPVPAAILVAIGGMALFHGSLPGMFVWGTLWTMCAWAMSTTMLPLIREVGAGRDDGRVVGLVHFLWSAGALCGTLTGGYLLDVAPIAPFVPAFACLACAVAAGEALRRIGGDGTATVPR